MKKGFLDWAAYLIMGMTLSFGLILAPAIKNAEPPCEHSVRIFLRDTSSGLLSEALDHNTNISGQVSYEDMPDSLFYSTQEDIVYLRDDKDLIFGYMTDDVFKAWLKCKK
jgi:hypothetical protein